MFAVQVNEEGSPAKLLAVDFDGRPVDANAASGDIADDLDQSVRPACGNEDALVPADRLHRASDQRLGVGPSHDDWQVHHAGRRGRDLDVSL